MAKVERSWFSKGAQVVMTERDYSKDMNGIDRDVRCLVEWTRNFANGAMRVGLRHQDGWGFTIAIPSSNEIVARVRPS